TDWENPSSCFGETAIEPPGEPLDVAQRSQVRVHPAEFAEPEQLQELGVLEGHQLDFVHDLQALQRQRFGAFGNDLEGDFLEQARRLEALRELARTPHVALEFAQEIDIAAQVIAFPASSLKSGSPPDLAMAGEAS